MGSFFLILAMAAAMSEAVVVDRIAAIVGKHVIKTSDIDRDLRLTAFLNRQPIDMRSAEKHKSAERLIDQQIIRNELATGEYSRATDADAEWLLKQVTTDRFQRSDARLRSELARYGLTKEQLQAQLLWQLTVLRFIDQRFRPGVLITDEEVRKYYDDHLVELKRGNPAEMSFEALSTKIRSTLEGERINQDFETWLDQARKRNRIEYREGAFQ
jgi:peptidyl-prolyl cis-trans isomerase SurA